MPVSPADVSLKKRGLGKLGLSVLVGLILYSCATVPRQSTGDWLTALPGDGTVYFSITLTPEIRAVMVDPFIELGLFSVNGEMSKIEVRDLMSMVDRMERIHGSVRLTPDSSPVLYAVVEGRFPASAASILLNRSGDWRKRSVKITGVTGMHRYWINEAGSLQVSVPRSRVLLVSNEDVRYLLQSYLRTIPPAGPGFFPPEAGPPDAGSPDGRTPADRTPADSLPSRAFASTDILAIVPELKRLAALGSLKENVRNAWILIDGEEETFHLQTGLGLATQGDAAKFTLGVRLILLYLLKTGDLDDLSGKLKEARIVSRGNFIYITDLRLSKDELKGMMIGIMKWTDGRSD